MDPAFRPTVLAAIQGVAGILTFVLDIFTTGAAAAITGISGLSLISIAQTARLLNSFGGLGALGPLPPEVEAVFIGGEAALAFTIISLVAAGIAGIIPFLGLQEPQRSKFYAQPSNWFFFSGICGIGPFGYCLGIFLQTGGGFGLGPAFFTSIVMIVLGILFGCIERRNVVQTIQVAEVHESNDLKV